MKFAYDNDGIRGMREVKVNKGGVLIDKSCKVMKFNRS